MRADDLQTEHAFGLRTKPNTREQVEIKLIEPGSQTEKLVSVDRKSFVVKPVTSGVSGKTGLAAATAFATPPAAAVFMATRTLESRSEVGHDGEGPVQWTNDCLSLGLHGARFRILAEEKCWRRAVAAFPLKHRPYQLGAWGR